MSRTFQRYYAMLVPDINDCAPLVSTKAEGIAHLEVLQVQDIEKHEADALASYLRAELGKLPETSLIGRSAGFFEPKGSAGKGKYDLSHNRTYASCILCEKCSLQWDVGKAVKA